MFMTSRDYLDSTVAFELCAARKEGPESARKEMKNGIFRCIEEYIRWRKDGGFV